jgi:protein-disulfide isomerase/serine/threonine protein kinase
MIESLSPAPGSVFAGVYRILKQLGEADGVASFLAEQPGVATPRTLKILSPRLVEDPAVRARFEADLRVGARVASPNVAAILDAGIDAATGQPWLAREALKGESLASFAEGRGAITVGEVADLFEQLCNGVGAIHAAGLTHQDLRPATIFLQTPTTPGIPWVVRVIDLGLAPFLAAARRTASVGEPLWMAPEQADVRPPIQPQADVWSLGLIAFFLLVGKSYWKGASAGSMLPAAVHQEVVFDPIVAASTRAAELGVMGRIPDGFDAWFARCVARLPGERFPDARAALAALLSTWGVRARAPLPSFALGADSTRAPLPSFSLDEGAAAPGPSRGPLPSFGFEGGFGSTPPPAGPPRGPSFGPPPMAPMGQGPGAPQGYAYPPQGFAQPPLPTWGVAPAKRASNPLPWILAGVGLLVVFVVIGIVGYAALTRYRERAIAAAAAADDALGEDGSIPISSRDPSWGDRYAPVTIVEFGELECPYCKKVDVTLAALKTQYGPTKLRIVWKNNPLEFHKGARPAALAAMAAFDLGGNEAFWRFHDHAFAAQSALTDENFASWALDAGVDMVKWRQAVAAQAGGPRIDADMAIGKAAGVRGTPAFFINGVHLGGAQAITKFTEVIDAQLALANAAIAAGTPPAGVYAKLSLENAAKNPPPKDDGSPAKDETTVWRVPVGGSPSRGPATAAVTIVEFGDFQCPFCMRSEKVLNEVRERFGPKVRLVWKHNPLPFHQHAAPAAELAIQAFTEQGDAGFWQVHDALYDNPTRLEDADLLSLGKRLRLRGAAPALTTKKHEALIKADQRLAASLDAKGTPTFFLNGRRLVGAQPIEKFVGIIEEEILHAEEIVSHGVAPSDVYAEIQKTAVSGK